VCPHKEQPFFTGLPAPPGADRGSRKAPPSGEAAAAADHFLPGNVGPRSSHRQRNPLPEVHWRRRPKAAEPGGTRNRAPPARCDGSRPQQAGDNGRSARMTLPGLPDPAEGGTRPRFALAWVGGIDAMKFLRLGRKRVGSFSPSRFPYSRSLNPSLDL